MMPQLVEFQEVLLSFWHSNWYSKPPIILHTCGPVFTDSLPCLLSNPLMVIKPGSTPIINLHTLSWGKGSWGVKCYGGVQSSAQKSSFSQPITLKNYYIIVWASPHIRKSIDKSNSSGVNGRTTQTLYFNVQSRSL